MTTTHSARAQVLGTVTELLQEVFGGGFDDAISMETSFSKDLALESIEFVVLAEKLQGRYGHRVNFASWLSGKDLDEIIALRVGDLVEFIEQCL